MLGVSFRAMMRRPVSDPSAWKVINSVTLGSAASSVSFTGIDTTYRMFRVTAYVVKDGTGGFVNLRLNNDSGRNYDYQQLSGDSTSISAARGTGQAQMSFPWNVQANTQSFVEFTIGKQLATAAAMGLGSQTVTGNIIMTKNAFRWNNTADLINRIDLISGTGNFAAGTVVVLEAC